MVFYSNFFESEAYHKAYYASISAIERWELVTKQRQPWYIWSGWFIEWTWQGRNNWWSDSSLSWFSYLWDKENKNTVFWTINSRTTRIPASWKWDIERTLSTGDSKHYNKMWYENAEVFLLYYDDFGGNPYQKIEENNLTKSTPSQITWQIRLPGLLKDTFHKLDTGLPLVWSKGSMPGNDGIVDRQFRWEYTDWWSKVPFTIYSTQKIELVNYERKEKTEEDSVFREWDINDNLNFKFWDSGNPFNTTTRRWFKNNITVISEKESEILNTLGNKFNNIFTYPYFQKSQQLRFSLLNLVQWSGTYLYPFLEYYVDFWWEPVSDKYYTINGEWNFKDYQINTIIQKPTVKETILWSFTSIF